MKYVDAEPLLIAGAKGMLAEKAKIPIAVRPQLQMTCERLIRLYEATDRPAEAAKWRAERLKCPPERAPPPRPAKP